ncbi:MAG: hypothetical protein IJY61_07725 [Candidatus Gastranaerophilales bacterium]|nr:hypothetical protein [Candidatus Gastranaerophilales bacterium]
MNKVLDKKYSYLSNFFEAAISQNRLFHSIILYGSNNFIQYAMALELARKLNCLEDGNPDCNCQNCRWIRENKHPAVMTISKIDNKNDDSKTVISKQQVDEVLDKIFSSSEYHRVFIFCDAEIKELSQTETQEKDEFLNTGFASPQEGKDSKFWYPTGINGTCFQPVVANALLKSIEEPPSNTTFIFLTKDRDDLIQTIVSRSQAFYMADAKFTEYNTTFFEQYFSNYPNFDKGTVLDFVQTLLKYQSENDLEPTYVIDCIQYYLFELLKSNSDNKFLVGKIYRDIEKTEKSKKMLNSYIKENTVYEDLALYFTKI